MLYFLFAEQPLTALIAVNIQSPCYVTNAEYYVTEFFIKGLQKHQGFIITTTVKPFYGINTKGSGLNRLINLLCVLCELCGKSFLQMVCCIVLKCYEYIIYY